MRLTLLYCLLLPFSLVAQSEEFKYDSTLVSVSFKVNPSDTSSFQVIVENDTTFAPYLEPHYIVSATGNNTSKPVSYVSGSSAKIKAVFKMKCKKGPNQPSPYIYIKGFGVADAATFDFGLKTAALTSDNTYIFEDTCVKRFVKNQIGYFKSFNIEWKMSLDKVNWVDAGMSKNTVYVLLGRPAPENAGQGFRYLETIFYNSCKYGKGVKSGNVLFTRMKSLFASRNLKRVDGSPLYYYYDWTTRNLKTDTLVKSRDGQCVAWAKFFIDCHRLHGLMENRKDKDGNDIIAPAGLIAKIQSSRDKSEGIYTKSWSLIGSGSWERDPIIYTHVNVWGINPLQIPNSSGGTVPQPIGKVAGKWQYIWKKEEVKYNCCDASGTICSQNNNCPQARFGNHQFVYIFHEFFDPSYGLDYCNLSTTTLDYCLKTIQNQSIDMFFSPSSNQSTGAYFDLVRAKDSNRIQISMDFILY